MGCSCGGDYIWDAKQGKLMCCKCGKFSPYQPMPRYAELLAENERLKKEVARLRDRAD